MPLLLLERYYTLENLKRKLGTNRARDFLDVNAYTVSKWEDDFQGDTLNLLYQSTAAGAASAAAAISTGVVNGAILLDAGTADTGRSDLSWGLHYRGDLNAVFIARFSINTLTTRKFEIGFTDKISGTDAGAVSVKAGNGTWNATDACILAYDTTANTNLTLMGVSNATAATSIDYSVALAAATYYYFGVALVSTDAYGFVLDADGRLIESRQIASALRSTILLTPWLFIQNKGPSSGQMTVDWLRAYQRRTTAQY